VDFKKLFIWLLNFIFSDFLALLEPHLKSTDTIDVPGYRCILRTNCTAGRNSEGALILVKDHTQHLSDNDADKDVQHSTPTIIKHCSSTGHSLVVRFQILDMNMVVAYKSPQYSKSLFIKTMDDTFRSIEGDVVVMGDFNMDLRKSEGRKILDLFNAYQLESKLNLGSFSSDGGTHIDYCFSNVANVQAWFYETYYSYHKAICVVMPKK
jgi:hypothetical protein